MDKHISKFTKEYYETKLPFELSEKHKYLMNQYWKNYGIIFVGLFEEIYDIYIHSSHCDKCKNKFKHSRDRQLDHDHLITDDFNVRGIICNNCNHKNYQSWVNNTGKQYICKIKDKKYTQGFCFQIQIQRNGKRVITRKRKTLEEAVECRNKCVADNPQYGIILVD